MVNTSGEMAKKVLMWCCGHSLRLVSVAIIFLLAITTSEHRVHAARKQNCGLKCFTYECLKFNIHLNIKNLNQ